MGITPACAGKRVAHFKHLPSTWDHPRVCGEKSYRRLQFLRTLGSPPRVRGKVFHYLAPCFLDGITPACAGKSNSIAVILLASKDHPRVCGEKAKKSPKNQGLRSLLLSNFIQFLIHLKCSHAVAQRAMALLHFDLKIGRKSPQSIIRNLAFVSSC
jgi:hypothetical protein